MERETKLPPGGGVFWQSRHIGRLPKGAAWRDIHFCEHRVNLSKAPEVSDYICMACVLGNLDLECFPKASES